MLSKVLRSLRPALPNSRRSKIATLAMTLTFASLLNAQTVSSSAGSYRAPADRLTQPIQENNRVTLQGTLHPLANKANDRGAVADGMKLERIQIVLKRSDAQESALKQLIGDLHTPGSASYHKWLTPEDFGKQFGPSDADLAKLEGWLGSHGFSITKLNAGRQILEIAGTAGQFHDTFHSQIHTYQVKGETGSLETHFANASAPDIPAAVAPVFGGFTKLNNFRLRSYAHVLGKAQYTESTHESKPEWTYTGFGSTDLVLAPADLAVQYDLNPLYTASTPINGTGQSIAIVNESNINIALVNNYRKLFNLPVNPPQVIIDGNDPGIDGVNSPYGPNGASFEAYLDVEVAGAVAPNAQVNLVIADSTALDDGLTLAIERAVNSNISPVISLSFGGCEIIQASFNATISSLWEQAAAQGITVLVSTGDSGSAGCDDDNSQYFAVGGQAVNGLGSTPYNVAVGGTDFYYAGGTGDLGTYWKNLTTPTNSTPAESLKSRIPEQPFNSSQYGLNLQNYYTNSGSADATSIFAAGGGASTCGIATVDSNGNVTACAPYPKPSWQTGFGDSVRDLPDVSMFGALDSSDSYTPICAEDGDCEAVASSGTVQISGVGGTSVSAPTFAGVMALVNQKYGPQGQANYVLYPLAKQFPSAFNDVVAGTNSVPCAIGTVNDADNGGAAVTSKNCQTVTSALLVTDNRYGTATEGEIGFAANTPAYSASAGYDLASGLGSIDANNLVTNWGSVKVGSTTTTLTTSSASFAHGTPVTISGSVTGASPTGDVALLTTSTDASQQGAGYFTLSSGSYSGSIDTLPGGTYNISGQYGGDGSNAASTSAPVSITVAPESSKTLLQVFSAANSNSNLAPITSGTSYTYGIPLILSAQPTNSSGKVSTVPTGSVAFSDSSTVLNTAVVNVKGDAEYNGVLAPGSHSITATYSGDGSYNSSTSSAVAFSVAKDTPVISAIDYDVDQQGENIVTSTGSIFTVLVENSVSFTGLPIQAPSGTLTLTGGPTGTTQSATLAPGFDPNTGSPAGIAIFTAPASTPSQSYAFNFSYAGDTNYNSAAKLIAETFNSYTGGLTSTTTATATATATSPAAGIQVTVTVAGPSGSAAPTGAVLVLSSGAYNYNLNELVYITGANLPASTGNSVTVTLPPLNSANLYQGSNQITVQYLGDTNYYPSATTLSLSNPLSDFTLVPLTTTVNVPSTGVDTDTLEVGSTNGFAGAVALSCAGAGGVTCSVNPSSASVAAAGSTPVTVNINTSGASAAGTYNVVITGTDSTGNFIHTVGLQVVTPKITIQAFTVSNSAAIAVASQGGTGSSTVSVTPTNGFTGTVALTCAVTASPSGATEVPTCSLSPASANLTAAAAVTSTLTINTTAQTTGSLHLPRRGFFTAAGGVTLATLLCLGLGASAGRRGRRALRAVRALRILALALFFALVAGAGMGCGGGSSSSGSGGGSGGGGGSTGGTTTGAYTVTVTGTSGTTTATTTVGLTVN